MRLRHLSLALAFGLASAACATGDTASVGNQPAAATGVRPSVSTLDVRPGESFPGARCLANRDAGTITFFTGLDLAATAATLDVIVAADAGYYDELCLDVDIVPSLADLNYDAVATGAAQIASGGSFGDLVAYAVDNEVELSAVGVEGRTAIDTLIVKAGEATQLSDLEGTSLGANGTLPPAVDVMLRGAGLRAGDDYETIQIERLDPIEDLATGGVVGVPGRKSVEVGVLERAGVGVTEFDPLDFGVPGSFGLIFASTDFINAHPTAAQDFVRATLRGLGDAVADPQSAARIAFELIVTSGNRQNLSLEGELFRWETEAELILDGTPEGLGLGVPDPDVLQAEVDAYRDIGFFVDASPDASDFVATALISNLYGRDDDLVWPG